MGDRKGRKDKEKGQRQKQAKHDQAAKDKQDKQKPLIPFAGGPPGRAKP